jgi:hypothetical protein
MTHALGLIRPDVTVENGKVGTTNADFSVTVGAKQLKRFDQVQDVMRLKYYLKWRQKLGVPRRSETVPALFSRTDSELVYREM